MSSNQPKSAANAIVTTALSNTGNSLYQLPVGQLLVDAQIITNEQMRHAFEMAERFNQPLGKVFASMGILNQDGIEKALAAQSMIQSGNVKRELAVKALAYAYKSGVDFKETVNKISPVAISQDVTAELEALLLESGMANEQIIKEARKLSLERKLPLANSLLTMRCMGFPHLNYAFECLHLIRQGRLTKQQAVDALTVVKDQHEELASVLHNRGHVSRNTLSRIRIGDLLLASKVVNEKDMISMVEESLAAKQLIGETLVDYQLISKELLAEVIALQKLCSTGAVEKRQAARILRKAVTSGVTAASVAKQEACLKDEPESASGLELLIVARFTTPQVVRETSEYFGEFGMGELRSLVAAGEIEEHMYDAAKECGRLLHHGWLDAEDAVAVLHHCDRTLSSVKEALDTLKISKVQEHASRLEKTVERAVKSSNAWRPRFSKCMFFLSLLGLLAVTAVMTALSVMLKPLSFNGMSYCIIAAIAILVFGAIRKNTQRTLMVQMEEIKQQTESANENLKRLLNVSIS